MKKSICFLSSILFLSICLFPVILPAPNRKAFDHTMSEDITKKYTNKIHLSEKGCEIDGGISVEQLENFLTEVGKSDSLCKIEKQSGMKKITRKHVFLPNYLFELDHPLKIINKTPQLELFIEGPKVAELDFPMSVFQPAQNFQANENSSWNCALILQNNILLSNVMVEGFPEK